MAKHLRRGSHVSHNFIQIIFWVLLILAVVIFALSQKGYTKISNVTYNNNNLPRQYSGYKIAHIANIDNENVNIANKVKKSNPDIIIVSGGLIDANGNTNNSTKILDELNNIAPTFYIINSDDRAAADTIISNTSATYIGGKYFVLPSVEMTAEEYIAKNCDNGVIKEAAKINDDSAMYIEYITEELANDSKLKIQVAGLIGDDADIYKFKDNFYSFNNDEYAIRILVTSNINYAKEMSNTDVDLVICSGTYGTHENYGSGIYDISDYTLVTSSGVCKNIPNDDRFLNYPEVQIITLSDNNVYKRNALERLLDNFVHDTGTVFDNDGGFKNHVTNYGDIGGESNEN